MNWHLDLFFRLAVIATGSLVAFMRAGLVSARVARRIVVEGCCVIDLRDESQSKARMVPVGVSVPFSRIRVGDFARLPAKDRAFLLVSEHGKESAAARRLLRANGYTKVYDLGSYWRALSVFHKIYDYYGPTEE